MSRPLPVPAPTPALHGTARLLRGWGAALVATLVAAGSHTMAGPGHHDDGPSPLILALTVALAGPLCTALAGRMLSWPRLSAGVLLSQGIFHALYSLGSGAVHAPAGPAAGHSHHVQQLVITAEAPATVDAAPAMVWAHVLAAAVTVVLLRQGERAVLTAADWVLLRRTALQLVPRVLTPLFDHRGSTWHRPPILRPFRDVVTGLQWRGPPLVSPVS